MQTDPSTADAPSDGALRPSTVLIEDPEPGLLARFVRRILLAIYRSWNWTAVGAPPAVDKYVLLAAPHTSNWDFVHFLGLTHDVGIRPHFMAKQSLFKWPIGGFMRQMGGVAIDRSRSSNMVDAMVAEFARRKKLALTIAPEGTRGKTTRWKTGFYQIAMKAKVPIVLGHMDYARRVGGIGATIWPTGDFVADMRRILEEYRNVIPRVAANRIDVDAVLASAREQAAKMVATG